MEAGNNTVEITLRVPADLARDAAQFGLLTTERLVALLEKELERQYHIQRLSATLAQLHTVQPPLTPEEIDEEIQAYRAEKHTQRQAHAHEG